MNNKKMRAALIGCGTVAPNHIYALTLDKNVTVAALCDIRTENAKRLKEKFSLDCNIYTDYKEMLDKEELDVVHISTPHFLHAQMAIDALGRNINVMLEKPMCINEQEINALLNAEKKSSATACVCFQNRFISATQKALEIANADGGVKSAHFSVFWKRDTRYYTDSDWRGKYSTEGGGVMINQAIHSLDMLTLFLGKPKRLWATTANHHLKGIIEVEDTCEGLIEFESGNKANFYATTSSLGKDDTEICLQTENHKIIMNLPNLTVDGERISFENETNFVGKECYGNGHAKIIELFYRSLREGKESPVTLESAQYALRILLAAYKSQDMETII